LHTFFLDRLDPSTYTSFWLKIQKSLKLVICLGPVSTAAADISLARQLLTWKNFSVAAGRQQCYCYIPSCGHDNRPASEALAELARKHSVHVTFDIYVQTNISKLFYALIDYRVSLSLACRYFTCFCSTVGKESSLCLIVSGSGSLSDVGFHPVFFLYFQMFKVILLIDVNVVMYALK
jgi:hypothetical protein